MENWTNQKLEFPELSQELGSTDRWYPPENVDKHTRYDNLFFVGLFRKDVICEQSLRMFSSKFLGSVVSVIMLNKESFRERTLCANLKI